MTLPIPDYPKIPYRVKISREVFDIFYPDTKETGKMREVTVIAPRGQRVFKVGIQIIADEKLWQQFVKKGIEQWVYYGR